MKTIIYPLFKFTFESRMVFFFPQVGYGSSFLRFWSWQFRLWKIAGKKFHDSEFFGAEKKRWFNPWILCQFYRKMEGSWRNFRSGQISNFWHEGFEGFLVWFSCIIASCIICLEFDVFFCKMMIFFPFDSLDRIWLVKNQGRRNLLSLPLSFSGCTECVGSLATRRKTWGGR